MIIILATQVSTFVKFRKIPQIYQNSMEKGKFRDSARNFPSHGKLWALFIINVHCVPIKNIPDIFDSNMKTNDQILIIFGTKIPDLTCHQTTI